MKDLKVLGGYDLERPLWVETSHSRTAACDPKAALDIE